MSQDARAMALLDRRERIMRVVLSPRPLPDPSRYMLQDWHYGATSPIEIELSYDQIVALARFAGVPMLVPTTLDKVS